MRTPRASSRSGSAIGGSASSPPALMAIASARASPWPISTAMRSRRVRPSLSMWSGCGAGRPSCLPRPMIPPAAGCADEDEAMTETSARIERPGRRRGRAETGAAPSRSAAYRRLHNPFGPLRVFSDDQVESMHQTALRVLEELGMRVLLPQARRIFAAAGAAVDEASQMVRLDRGLVEGAMAKAPPEVELIARDGSRSVVLGGRRMAVVPVAGPPHVTDSDRGK